MSIRRRQVKQSYPTIEVTFKKTGEKETVKLMGKSESGKSLKVIFGNNEVGYIYLNRISEYKEL